MRDGLADGWDLGVGLRDGLADGWGLGVGLRDGLADGWGLGVDELLGCGVGVARLTGVVWGLGDLSPYCTPISINSEMTVPPAIARGIISLFGGGKGGASCSVVFGNVLLSKSGMGRLTPSTCTWLLTSTA